MSTYETNRYTFSGANVTGIPTSAISSGTFADARLSSSSVTQHVDLSNLSASNLTSGTVPNARYGTPTFSAANLTSIPAAGSTIGTWTPQFKYGSTNVSSSTTFASYAKNGRWVGVHAMCFMNGSGGSNGDYTRVYVSNLPYTSANISKHAGFTGKFSAYNLGSGHCTAEPNSTNMLLFSNVSSSGRNSSPPIFTNSGTEGAYFDRGNLREVETANFGAKYFHFECFYLANS